MARVGSSPICAGFPSYSDSSNPVYCRPGRKSPRVTSMGNSLRLCSAWSETVPQPVGNHLDNSIKLPAQGFHFGVAVPAIETPRADALTMEIVKSVERKRAHYAHRRNRRAVRRVCCSNSSAFPLYHQTLPSSRQRYGGHPAASGRVVRRTEGDSRSPQQRGPAPGERRGQETPPSL